MYTDISILGGKTLKRVSVNQHSGDDEIHFVTTDGKEYKMNHTQDCCESVSIEDIDGDLQDLVGDEILVAEERSNSYGYGDKLPPECDPEYPPESCTYTFYKLATVHASVVIRWYGESNGYYSEGVDFCEMQ